MGTAHQCRVRAPYESGRGKGVMQSGKVGLIVVLLCITAWGKAHEVPRIPRGASPRDYLDKRLSEQGAADVSAEYESIAPEPIFAEETPAFELAVSNAQQTAAAKQGWGHRWRPRKHIKKLIKGAKKASFSGCAPSWRIAWRPERMANRLPSSGLRSISAINLGQGISSGSLLIGS